MNTLLQVQTVCVLLAVFGWSFSNGLGIVGGNAAKIQDYPYQLSLQKNNYHHCGASLLSSTAALTAAHCVYRESANELRVSAGSDSNRSGMLSKVKDIIVHPQYRDDGSNDFDLAVLKVQSLLFSNKIRPIALPRPGENFPVGTMTKVTGWGSTSEGSPDSRFLMVVSVPIMDLEECKKSYGYLPSHKICAGYSHGGKDACKGDSGGPQVADNKLIGVISSGRGCGRPNYPGLYIKVSSFVSWIKNKANL